VQPGFETPIDDQRLTGCPHSGPAPPRLPTAPLRLQRGDQPAEVPRRPGISRRLGLRQQPLSRNPTRRLRHPLGHQVDHQVEVASYASIIRFTVLCVTPQRSAARRNCPHPDRRQSHPSVPSCSSMQTPSAVPVTGSTPSPLAAEGPQGLRHDERRVETLTGHQWDFLMATDKSVGEWRMEVGVDRPP
jgi:hypothetical protein